MPLTFDAGPANAAIQAVINGLKQYNVEVDKATVKSATFDAAGGKMRGTFDVLTQSGQRLTAAVRETSQGFDLASIKIGEAARGMSLFQQAANIGFSIVVAKTFLNTITGIGNQIAEASKEAADFSRQIALIQTISSDSGLNRKQWAEGLRATSDELGMPVAEVASAAYDALSNQVAKGADAFTFMSKAGELARTTNASLADSVDLLSSAMNSFGISAADADRVNATFFSTIDLGRVKVEDIKNTFGRVGFTASTLGLTLEELGAGLSTITRQGIESSTAQTLLGNVLQKLLNPTKELQKIYDDLGVSTGETFIKTYGAVGAFEKLKEVTGGSKAKLAELFNEYRGFQGSNILTERLEEVLRDLKAHAEAGPAFEAAASLTGGENFGKRFEIQMNQIHNMILREFREPMLESVVKITEKVGGLSNLFKTTFRAATDGAVMFAGALAGIGFAQITANLGNILSALQAIKVAALAIDPVLAGAAALGIAASAVAISWYRSADIMGEIADDSERTAASLREAANTKFAESFNKPRHDFEAALRTASQGALQDIALVRKALDDLADTQRDAGREIAESVKDSFEAMLSTVRKSVQEIGDIAKRHFDNVRRLSEEPSRIRESADEDAFERRLKEIEVARQNALRENLDHPRNIERRYNAAEYEAYKKRIADLGNEFWQAFEDAQANPKGKGIEKALRALEERRSLINKMTTETYEDTERRFDIEGNVHDISVTKYKFGTSGKDYEQELHRQMAAVERLKSAEQARGEAAQEAHAKAQMQFKGIEDAAKDVEKLTPWNKQGEFNDMQFKSFDDFLAKYDEKVAKVRELMGDYRHGITDPNALRSFDQQTSIIEEQLRSQRANFIEQKSVKDKIDANTKSQQEFNSKVSEGSKYFQELEKSVNATNSAMTSLVGKSNELLLNFRNLPGAKDIEPQVDAAAKALQKAQESGKPGDIAYAKAAIKALSERASTEEVLLGTEGDVARFDARGRIIKPAVPGTPDIRDESGKLIAKGTPGEGAVTLGAALRRLEDAANTLGSYADKRSAIQQQLESMPADARTVDQILPPKEEVEGKIKDLKARRAEGSITIADFEAELAALQDQLNAATERMKSLTGSSTRIMANPPSAGIIGGFRDVTPEKHALGGIAGGSGTDTILSWLTPGETVIDVRNSRRFYSELTSIRRGQSPTSNKSGVSNTVNIGDVIVQGASNPRETADAVLQTLQRKMRMGIIR